MRDRRAAQGGRVGQDDDLGGIGQRLEGRQRLRMRPSVSDGAVGRRNIEIGTDQDALASQSPREEMVLMGNPFSGKKAEVVCEMPVHVRARASH